MPAAPSVTIQLPSGSRIFFLDPYQRWFVRAAISTYRGAEVLCLAPRTKQNAIAGNNLKDAR
jgi:hypothetical protein